MSNKPKTCDTLAVEILDKINDCLATSIQQEVNKPKGYDNFVFLTRVNNNYNSLTISDGNLQIIMQREWADEDQLTVSIKSGSDQLELLDFMKSVSQNEVTESRNLELESQVDNIKAVCGELYDLIKSKPV